MYFHCAYYVQIDPEAVACLLRILVHYIRCVMSVDISQFTFEQRECFRNTIEVQTPNRAGGTNLTHFVFLRKFVYPSFQVQKM